MLGRRVRALVELIAARAMALRATVAATSALRFCAFRYAGRPCRYNPRVSSSDRLANDRPAGRVLGLDVGSRRIGMAVTDPLGITAQGIETLQRRNKRTD